MLYLKIEKVEGGQETSTVSA